MTPSLRRFAASSVRACRQFLFVAAVLPLGRRPTRRSTPRQGAAAPPARRTASKPCAAASLGSQPGVSGKDAYLIVDATSGRELASDQPDELRHPASLTKLMTLYLTFSALDSGRLSLGDALPVSINALNAPPTKMGMPPGGTVSVRDAMMGAGDPLGQRCRRRCSPRRWAATKSSFAAADDAARRASSACRRRCIRNASGLPNREQVTTARDMARLANALLRDFPHYYPVFSVQSYPLPRPRRSRTITACWRATTAPTA